MTSPAIMVPDVTTRRGFLFSAALLASGAILSGCSANMGGTVRNPAVAGTRKLGDFGVQLYTVRDRYMKDPVGTLKMLAAIGFKQVEYAELPNMPISAAECKKIANDLGMTIPSAGFQPEHFFNELPKVIDITSALGATYGFNGWIHPPDRTLSGLMKQAEAFNGFGAALKKAGLQYMYHNHDFEFSKIDGDRSMQDVLMQNTDPDLVAYEIDMFWVVHGGGDIIDYLTRYPNRFVACHIKDRTATGKMVNVGEGVIDWKSAIAKAKEVGIKYYFVEHDEPVEPVEVGLRISYQYVRDLLF